MNLRTIYLTSGNLAEASEESDLTVVRHLLQLVLQLVLLPKLTVQLSTVQLRSRSANSYRYPAPGRPGCPERGGILLITVRLAVLVTNRKHF